MDTRPTTPRSYDAVLALGGNVGPVVATFRKGVGHLQSGGFAVSAVSGVYRSAPEGGGSQPSYLNAVVRGRWIGAPHGLLQLARGVERAAGRTRGYPGAPRTLDVDLILIPGVRLPGSELALPHPRWRSRAFVLAPLAEVAPGWLDPDGELTLAELWQRLRPHLAPIEPVAPPSAVWSPTA